MINFIIKVLLKLTGATPAHIINAYNEIKNLDIAFEVMDLRKTEVYKRMRRHLKVLLFFKKYNDVLSIYVSNWDKKHIGRVIWNIIRDHTRYTVSSDGFGSLVRNLILGEKVLATAELC